MHKMTLNRPVRKSFGLEAQPLENRQIRVVVSTDQVDRSGDVVVQKGIDLSNFKASGTVLWNHNQDHPVAACLDIGIKNGRLEALTQFPEPSISAKADEVYGLVKAGVINAASIGFLPLVAEPIDKKNPRGGVRFDSSELLEFSFVSVPANPSALIVERSFGTSSRMTRKGLFAVSELAYLLQILGYQVDDAFAERAREGDASAVPEQLREALNQLGAALVAMTSEEVSELLSGLDPDAGDDGYDDIIMLSMMRGLFKQAGGPLIKAGRQFSAANAKAMRGHLAKIGEGHQAMCKMLDEADADQADDEDAEISDDDDDPEQKAQARRRREAESLALAGTLA